MRKERKKAHNKIVNYMRRMNKNIGSDAYLGINRFRIDMASEDWERFEDGSGGILNIVFKLTDTVTGNKALFEANNYNYRHRMFEYANDFAIRCSSGKAGHWPTLRYMAYDVHDIKEYIGSKTAWSGIADGYVIDTYNFTNIKM